MEEVFAGFLVGYLVAIICTPIAAVVLLRLRASSELLARLLPEGTPVVSLAVILHGGLMLGWTGLGIVFGLVLLAMRDESGALGSPNAAFTLFVAAITLAWVAPVAIVLRRSRGQILAGGIAVILLFGWLMPYLAQWADFSS